MTPTAAARAQTSAPSLRDRLKDSSLLKDRCYIDGAWVGSRSWFGRRDPASLPDLEYRTCATSTRADAKAAAERMIGRRETYMSGAA